MSASSFLVFRSFAIAHSRRQLFANAAIAASRVSKTALSGRLLHEIPSRPFPRRRLRNTAYWPEHRVDPLLPDRTSFFVYRHRSLPQSSSALRLTPGCRRGLYSRRQLLILDGRKHLVESRLDVCGHANDAAGQSMSILAILPDKRALCHGFIAALVKVSTGGHTPFVFKDVPAVEHHPQELPFLVHSLERVDVERSAKHIRCVQAMG